MINNTPSIQQYFHQHSLKLEHQGDEYYLQDKDFVKTLPKIQSPTLVDDTLTIYSQLQKKKKCSCTLYKATEHGHVKSPIVPNTLGPRMQ